MISTTNITDELNRCINIRYNLIELFIDASIWGYANRLYKSVKDVMTLYALEKALYNAVNYGFTDTQISDIIYKIREYLMILDYTSKVDYFLARYPSITCPLGSKGPYIQPPTKSGNPEGGNPVYITNQITNSTNISNLINNYYPTTYVTNNIVSGETTEWKSQDLMSLVTEDGQTTITPLNFNISNVDVDTVTLEVQGDDSYYNTDPAKDGYHIIGNTLYWHSFYDLKVGMQITIKWRE